jgi:hypothetical protein
MTEFVPLMHHVSVIGQNGTSVNALLLADQAGDQLDTGEARMMRLVPVPMHREVADLNLASKALTLRDKSLVKQLWSSRWISLQLRCHDAKSLVEVKTIDHCIQVK